MGDDKVVELLLQLVQDMSYIKAKMTALEEQALSARIEKLEAKAKELEKGVKSLENRSTTLEDFTRNSLVESKKQHSGILISLCMAVVGAILSLIVSVIL